MIYFVLVFALHLPSEIQYECKCMSFLFSVYLKTPCTPDSFKRDLSQVLESQERELESRRSSMMTMEILLVELNAERAAKNEEIQRLKV